MIENNHIAGWIVCVIDCEECWRQPLAYVCKMSEQTVYLCILSIYLYLKEH